MEDFKDDKLFYLEDLYFQVSILLISEADRVFDHLEDRKAKVQGPWQFLFPPLLLITALLVEEEEEDALGTIVKINKRCEGLD